jgi:hypothetical protein
VPKPLFLLLTLALIAITGCDSVLTTAALPSVREDGIVGEWKDLGIPGTKPDADPVVIKFMDGEYRVGSPEQFAKGDASRFTLARVGGVLITQTSAGDQCVEFGVQKGQPCWSLSHVELSKDRTGMNWYDFDALRLGQESLSGALNVAHSLHRQRKKDGSFDNAILFSADSSELGLFLESYVKRRAVFRLTGRLQRVR